MRRPTALLLAYDGTPFKGWQAQPGKPTVQGHLEDALRKALGLKTAVFGAARTDAGVHADGQVCHFVKEKVATTRALVELMEQLAGLLPPGIRVRSAALAHPSFHARSSAIGKRYRYRFSWGTEPRVAEAAPRSFAIGAEARPDWERARAAMADLMALAELPGLSSPSSDKRPAPGLTGFSLDAIEGVATLEVSGPAFRKHEIRNLAGHLAAIALGLADPGSLATLAQRRRPWMGAQAPARGLTLVEVLYPPELAPFGAAMDGTGRP